MICPICEQGEILKVKNKKSNDIFYTNTDSEEIEAANYSIVKIEDAVSAVEEFFETLQLPKCIEWEEL